MRIEESATRLDSRHELSQQYRVETETSVSFRGVLRELRTAAPAAPETAAATGDTGSRVRLMLQQLIASMMELLTGEKCRCRVDEIAALPATTAAGTPQLRAAAGAPARTMEWNTRVVEHIAEHERTEFDAAGRVRTADGREIDFDLSLTMCRDFQCTREYEERGRVEFHDPLVINYDGRAADLTDLRFDFDADGLEVVVSNSALMNFNATQHLALLNLTDSARAKVHPGGANLPLYDAMLDYSIPHVLARHEQGAAHMADGYARAARARGKVGVAMATLPSCPSGR